MILDLIKDRLNDVFDEDDNFTTDDMDHVVALIVKKACYEVW